jgi:transcriptional regulator with XRE-family HTH domain
MTQTELGVVLGVSQRSIAAYEAGERRPSPEVVNKIRQYFDLTIAEAWQLFFPNET